MQTECSHPAAQPRRRAYTMSKLLKSRAELDRAIAGDKPVFVMFYADWCPFSLAFLPEFEKFSGTADCLRVLADRTDDAEEDFDIEVFPTVIYFSKDGMRRLDGEPGAGLSPEELRDFAAECGVGNK